MNGGRAVREVREAREREARAGVALDAYLERHPGARTPDVLNALTPEPPFNRQDLAHVISRRVAVEGSLVLGVDLSLMPREGA